MIPMLDLRKQFDEIKDELVAEMVEVIESTRYVLGPKVKEFEEKVALYTGVPEAVGVASGTDALHLAVKALDIGEGDEVITTPFTFFATVEAILYERARPVFVDIEPDTFNMDASKVGPAISGKTKAVIPVHMFGHPADMPVLMEIARSKGIKVIEDCAQAFGASVGGRRAGGLGDAGCFSFYPSKNLGAYGDGGMITLRDEATARSVRRFRNHCSNGSYVHDGVGLNSRLDELQAAILLVKFKRIEKYNEKRREKARLYDSLLSGGVRRPVERPGFIHVYHQYTIMSPQRDRIQQGLAEAGVASTVYYPVPLHLQPALAFLGYSKGDFPNAERASREVLSIPIFPELEQSEIELIAKTISSI